MSNGLVAHLEEVAEDTTQDATKNDGGHDDEAGGEEYEGSGDESDVCSFHLRAC